MRRALLPLLILPAATAAAADGAPACRLAPAECAAVLREVGFDAELFAQDGEIVGLGLSPRDQAAALIRRDEDRMAARYRRLPAPVAAEVTRIQACLTVGGAEDADPDCR